VSEHLKPQGYLYLYNEPDEAELLQFGQSMFRVLNPFHLQTFDTTTLGRILNCHGFQPLFVSHLDKNIVCLAQKQRNVTFTPIEGTLVRQKLHAYRLARAIAILMLPPEVQQTRFGEDLPQIIEDAVVGGVATMDSDGNVALESRARREQTGALLRRTLNVHRKRSFSLS
jgi:hypothetical protein